MTLDAKTEAELREYVSRRVGYLNQGTTDDFIAAITRIVGEPYEQIIRDLLNALPDGGRECPNEHDLKCFKWSWDQLCGDCQDYVKQVREKTTCALKPETHTP